MKDLRIVEDKEVRDIQKIEEYNQDMQSFFPDWKPFVTKENFEEFLKDVEAKREGINNDGVKEIYYWFLEDEKIVGSGSIRLNPEVDPDTEKFGGHIFYQISPSRRKMGYGKELCHLLLEKMYEMGFEEAIITCFDTNAGSIKIIEHNGGKLIEKIEDKNAIKPEWKINRRYKIDIAKSLEEYEQNKEQKKRFK